MVRLLSKDTWRLARYVGQTMKVYDLKDAEGRVFPLRCRESVFAT
jgi:hypothetical protein